LAFSFDPPFQPARRTHPIAHFGSSSAVDAEPPSSEEDPRNPWRGPASGLQVLLVEDQTIIALDTEGMLLELGAASVHSFTTADSALAWLAAAPIDVGVLDVSLGTTTSFPVADLLAQRAVPFIFTTGYGDSGMFPQRFLDAPVVRKPYVIEALADALVRCLSSRPGA
jgi:DNA-binding NtrC family response regulator